MTESIPKTLSEGLQRRFLVNDCQGEGSPTISDFGSILGMSPEITAKLNLARLQGRARRAAQDKIMDGYMELIAATSVADADRFLQELVDRSRGHAS